MADLSSWAESNWFNLAQTAGLMGSLWITAAAATRDAKAREVENLLAISDHHRQLWTGISQRPELERIFKPNADVAGVPLKVAEEESINLAIVLYQTTWCIAKTGGMITLKELGADIRGFLALPLPHAVWEKTNSSRNPKFVRFVKRAMERNTNA